MCLLQSWLDPGDNQVTTSAVLAPPSRTRNHPTIPSPPSHNRNHLAILSPTSSHLDT
ncbi:hypothetical protein J6590_093416 [Homalodisca vitripennis]|nr:hypothetical protein J6590_092110 [Homalodisca vitripennis]KAG8309124.1 hypothetical protein J6590_093416 [Homalodisca vitripennis]